MDSPKEYVHFASHIHFHPEGIAALKYPIRVGLRGVAWAIGGREATSTCVVALEKLIHPGEQGYGELVILSERGLGVKVEPGITLAFGSPGRLVATVVVVEVLGTWEQELPSLMIE
jgi:hypothetical protein